MFQVSVIICTHNPRRDYLEKTIQGLQLQTLHQDKWELILVDNASSPKLEDSVLPKLHPHASLVFESTPGLTAARLCGGKESSSELLLFVDDDNVLAPNYFETALSIGREHKQLGCWGGSAIGSFEEHPEPWLIEFLSWIAVRKVVDPCWSNLPLHVDSTPIGAGLVVRKGIFDAYSRQLECSPIRQSLDRSGLSLMSGGDIDIAYTACKEGFGKGVFPELTLDHLISKERVQFKYVKNLIKMSSCSSWLLRVSHGMHPPLKLSSGKGGILRMLYLYSIPTKRNRLRAARERGFRRGERLARSYGN